MDMEEGLNAKRGAAVDGLPDDVLVEILSRVPARSIHRFKCVSKPWRDLIADPLHRKRLPQTLEGFFCSDGSGFDGRFISLPGRSAPPVDPSFSFLTKLSGLIKVLGSCNGLLLFEYGWNPATAYAVWNPATEEWVAVPNAGRPSHDPVLEERTYLIFDPAVSPHFHLLYIWQKDFLCEIEVRTYSSETRVWSDRASQQRRWQDEGDWKQWVNNGGAILTSTGACVNGMVHLIIFNMLDEYLIAMFDREGKTCRVIRCPDNCASLFVGQSQGCLHCVGLLVEREESCLKWAGLSIWVLKDYDTEEWVLKHRVSFLELFGQMSCLDGYNSNVLTIHPDRDLIFIHQNSNQKLISYDMDSKELHAFHTLGCDYVSLTPYVPSFLNLVLTNEH